MKGVEVERIIAALRGDLRRRGVCGIDIEGLIGHPALSVSGVFEAPHAVEP